MADEPMAEVRPLMETIIAMTAASVERAELDDRELLMVRLAAHVAVDAPVSSYLLSIAAATSTDLSLEDARAVLIAVAPIVGVPRVVSAAGTIAEALEIAIALDDAIADYSPEES